MQKLYCYVDESGQDLKSEAFIVVAVIVLGEERLSMQDALVATEDAARTGRRKWNKLKHDRRMKYLGRVLDKKIGKNKVFFGRYKKPIPYFFPVIEVLEKAITKIGGKDFMANVYVDGINKTVARALTNALRSRGISLRMVKGKRDESEPLIRLADMWAGCVRSALLGKKDAQTIFKRARDEKQLFDIGT